MQTSHLGKNYNDLTRGHPKNRGFGKGITPGLRLFAKNSWILFVGWSEIYDSFLDLLQKKNTTKKSTRSMGHFLCEKRMVFTLAWTPLVLPAQARGVV